MRLSAHARSTVRPRAFWIAVLGATVLLCIIGAYGPQNIRFPGLSPWLCGGALLLIGGICLFHLIRFGRQAFPKQRILILIGLTLFLGSHLWSQPPAAISWIGNAGWMLMILLELSQFVTFGKRKAGNSDGSLPGSAV